MSQYPTIWVLKDDRMGNNNQCLGVAERLGFNFIEKQIIYNKFAKLSNIVRGKTLIGININKSDDIRKDFPDIILSAGRKLAPVSRNIKQLSKGKSKIFHFMSPDCSYRDFDMVIQPKHDEIKANDKVLITIGATNRINEELLDKDKWLPKFSHLSSPMIALLVGGSTKNKIFGVNHALDLATKVNNFKEKVNAKSLLVTTSRRTNQESIKALKDNLNGSIYFHEYGSKDKNPFFGFLAVADYLIVTGDSVSMCTESATTGKPTYIYAPEELMSKKHKSFHQNLYNGNYASPLEENSNVFNNIHLNESQMVADIIKSKIEL